jgi:hypothetical protein
MLYKTLISNIVLCSKKETWTLSQKGFNIVDSFDRKILGKIFGPTPVSGLWRVRHTEENYILCVGVPFSTFLQLKTTLGWTRSKHE